MFVPGPLCWFEDVRVVENGAVVKVKGVLQWREKLWKDVHGRGESI